MGFSLGFIITRGAQYKKISENGNCPVKVRFHEDSNGELPENPHEFSVGDQVKVNPNGNNHWINGTISKIDENDPSPYSVTVAYGTVHAKESGIRLNQEQS